MQIKKIQDLIGDVPHMDKNQGYIIYDYILKNNIHDIIELGFAHGTSSCYMAAALEEKEAGMITTIDNKSALDRKPNVHEILAKCNLQKYVNPIFSNSSYNWELMKIIEKQTKDGICKPIFDLCYLDGSHNFEIDCCAFFLVDKLMKPGGAILFDDLDWTYADSPGLKNTNWVKEMPLDEKTTPHIRKLVDLIVISHPNYSDFSRLDSWFLAVKRSNIAKEKTNSLSLQNYQPKTSLYFDLKKLIKKAISTT